MVIIRPRAFDAYRELMDYRSQQITGAGANVIFIGSMRDYNDNAQVRQMTLEYYPGMTEKYLQKLQSEAIEKYELIDSMIVHRVGDVFPEDDIVLMSVWSAHRKAAYEACREMMEALKQSAPFWKKEIMTDGQARWVDKNTPGY